MGDLLNWLKANVLPAVLLVVSMLSIGAGIGVECSACTPAQQQTTKTVATEGLIIAADVCYVEAKDPNEPNWVRIACTVGGDVVHLLVSEATWTTIQLNSTQTAASLRDAGAGG